MMLLRCSVFAIRPIDSRTVLVNTFHDKVLSRQLTLQTFQAFTLFLQVIDSKQRGQATLPDLFYTPDIRTSQEGWLAPAVPWTGYFPFAANAYNALRVRI